MRVVARVLLQELGISDLPTCSAMLEDDLDDALEKLRSDSCRRAAAACPAMVDAATLTMKSCVMRNASCTAAAFVPATSGPAAQLVL